jgi:hypothetical protein
MIRKNWWMAAGLAFFLGCSGEGTDGGGAAPLPPGGGGGVTMPPPVSEGAPGAPSGTPTTPADGAAPAPGDAPKAADAPKSADAGSAVLTTEEIAEIKKLPEAEQALAFAQKVCPVSGEHLGEMGTPVKVTAGDQIAFLCCKSCMPEFNKDPQGTLAKLKK